MNSAARTDHYDVTILGAGISSTIVASILARQGLRVVMLEKNSHPKFAIGESTIPTTSGLLSLLAVRYGVPELKHLTSAAALLDNVSNTCGIKKNFGFVYHRTDAPRHPDEFNQVGAGEGWETEAHLFRQDVDAYMLHTAIRYGVRVHQNIDVTSVDLRDDGVITHTKGGRSFSSKFVVDGTGWDSVIARQEKLRTGLSEIRTHSRSIFTHMLDVRPYEECVSIDTPSKLSQGTLHHLFDGGWMWVIPFNNHERSKNRLVSVGLQLDPRRWPRRPELAAEDEFREFLQRHPDVALQFRDAKAVREWTVTGNRVQYNSHRNVGKRYALLSHAMGFIDPLFSRGLQNTYAAIAMMIPAILDAFRDGDFSVERFESLNTLQETLIRGNDQLVHSSYVSFRDHRLWNAWYRFWVLGSMYGMLAVNYVRAQRQLTGDDAWLDKVNSFEANGWIAPNDREVVDLVDRGAAVMSEVEAGQIGVEAAVERIQSLLDSADFIPPFYPIRELHKRTHEVGPEAEQRVLRWLTQEIPQHLRDKYFHFDLSILEKLHAAELKEAGAKFDEIVSDGRTLGLRLHRLASQDAAITPAE
ncbi:MULTISPECIES: NAD(P)/FAD-dependent oxidoreductase [Sandaracinus]|uniref:NAD(P)/FAD-dependent oxidoreductase n=1 Tax=Sandaracinus TaxID=1055688 RepID=UPI0019D45AD3|nr:MULTISPECIES: tryptophan 7-halogenase [Sandaracinus]QRN75757.1 halogenase [Sandaracinus sp.]UJR87257.1 Monodechloroaminopyrrolnitrin halogenase PrnC [Sandaracinus amylolyticus]